ncbi:MAG: fimbrillin family protein [Candidatus Limisoma sp.]
MKFYKIASIMVPAVLASCSTDDLSTVDDAVELRLTSSVEATRVATDDVATQSTQLAAGETVKVWVEDATTDDVLYDAVSLTADGGGALSGEAMYLSPNVNGVNVYAIHGGTTDGEGIPATVEHSVAVDQSAMGTTYTNADLLFAAAKGVKRLANPTTCNLNFYHMLSKVEVAIVSGGGVPVLAQSDGLVLNNVYTQCTVAFDKDADLTVRDNRCDLILGVDVLGSIKMTNAMSTDFSDDSVVYNEAIIVPQTVDSAEMVFTLTDGSVLKYRLPAGMEFESGKKYRFQITLALPELSVEASISDWSYCGAQDVEATL